MSIPQSVVYKGRLSAVRQRRRRRKKHVEAGERRAGRLCTKGTLTVDERQLTELVERFYLGFLDADGAALAELVAPEAEWIVPLDTVLSGAHSGPDGIASLRNRIDELTAGTWRPLSANSFDIATSPWHAVIMDRFLAQHRERRLDSHEAVIIAVEGGRIARLFHYLHDPAGFAAFWSR
jgi:ketosteroid isomerase-like protein